MISLMASGGLALIGAVLATPGLIRWLVSRGIGQPIREDGPQMHQVKAGIPTMGGLAMVAAAAFGYLLAHVGTGVRLSASGVLVIAVALGGGIIGLVDDAIKVHQRRSLGLKKRTKFGAQVVVAVAFAVAAERWAHVDTHLSFTRFSSTGIQLGGFWWAVWAVLVIVGTSNAVNLTDGLDGLASGSATFCFAILAIIGYWQFRHYAIYHVGSALDLALSSVALAGACLGFLWWNAAPARIIMGDTGALAIGSGLAALCLLMNLQLLLPVIGGLFVIVTLSVVIQVISYRVFGHRVFRMAPLHHHFELAGWPETTVIVRFWIMAGLFAALGLGLFYADFLSVPTAAVVSVTPHRGPETGGTRVVVTGVGFSTAVGGTAVDFGTKGALDVSCPTATRCTATAPSGTGTVDVTVVVDTQPSKRVAGDRFTYEPAAGHDARS